MTTTNNNIICRTMVERIALNVAAYEPKNHIRIYKWTQIDDAFTSVVRVMLNDGYTMNVRAMRGSQSDCETYVDLVNGDGKTYRVALLDGHDPDDWHHTMSLVILTFDDVIDSSMDVLWNDHAADTQVVAVWYETGFHDGVYTDEAGIRKMTDVRVQRSISRRSYSRTVISDMGGVARILKRHRGYARVRVTDIKSVTRVDAESSVPSGRHSLGYYDQLGYEIRLVHAPSKTAQMKVQLMMNRHVY